MSKLREQIVRNLEDFIKIVSELERKEKTEPGESWLWFRGQASAQWKLVPRLYRSEHGRTDSKAEDDENRELFAGRAPDLSEC